jgi:hypothetical protein
MATGVNASWAADMNSLNGLTWWVWTHKLYVFNWTKHVVRVDLGDSTPLGAVDIGTGGVFPITMKASTVTLSYYTDTRDLMSVFVWDSGSWTTSLTPMVAPICCTNDRQMLTRNLRNRKTAVETVISL